MLTPELFVVGPNIALRLTEHVRYVVVLNLMVCIRLSDNINSKLRRMMSINKLFISHP